MSSTEDPGPPPYEEVRARMEAHQPSYTRLTDEGKAAFAAYDGPVSCGPPGPLKLSDEVSDEDSASEDATTRLDEIEKRLHDVTQLAADLCTEMSHYDPAGTIWDDYQRGFTALLCSEDEDPPAPTIEQVRERLKGFKTDWEGLTDEQRAKLAAYDGPLNSGKPGPFRGDSPRFLAMAERVKNQDVVIRCSEAAFSAVSEKLAAAIQRAEKAERERDEAHERRRRLCVDLGAKEADRHAMQTERDEARTRLAECERVLGMFRDDEVLRSQLPNLPACTATRAYFAGKAPEPATGEVERLRALVDKYDADATRARNALTRFAIPDVEGEVPHHRALSVEERINRLGDNRDRFAALVERARPMVECASRWASTVALSDGSRQWLADEKGGG